MKYYSKLLHSLKPYVAGEQPRDRQYIKLNTNENAYPPSSGVAEVIGNFDVTKLRLYPDPEVLELRQALAKMHGVGVENIFVGNGSDEVLGFCFPAFFDRALDNPNPIVFPDITYSFYPVYADFFGVAYKTIPLDEDFCIDIRDYGVDETAKPTHINQCAKGLGTTQAIMIANPNAPTGIALTTEQILKIVKANLDKLVIIDEAYADFCPYSLVAHTAEYDNLLVVRTFSKSHSLAGLRVGYAVANKNLINALDMVKNSFNSYTLDAIAIKAGTAAVADKDYYQDITRRIIKSRESMCKELTDLGYTCLPSAANFIFLKKQGVSGQELFLKLKQNGILVRHFNKPKIQDYIRVSIGRDVECQAVIKVLSIT